MKSISKILLLIGALSLPFAIHAADGDSLKTKMSDTVITTKVKAAFAKDEVVEALDISVDTDSDGLVELSGTANTEAEAERAVKITKAVEGVTAVKNNITVLN